MFLCQQHILFLCTFVMGFGGVTILSKGMLLPSSPYAVTDRILDLVGH